MAVYKEVGNGGSRGSYAHTKALSKFNRASYKAIGSMSLLLRTLLLWPLNPLVP